MNAIVQDRYGTADVLKLEDIDEPVVGSGDVLFRGHAASAHIGDWHIMTGLPYLPLATLRPGCTGRLTRQSLVWGGRIRAETVGSPVGSPPAAKRLADTGPPPNDERARPLHKR